MHVTIVPVIVYHIVKMLVIIALATALVTVRMRVITALVIVYHIVKMLVIIALVIVRAIV